MSTLIIIFIVGYVFHWIYKGFDRIISFVVNIKRNKEES